ncbi:TetR family transcriptional regulator [Bacillus pseudomycoides]|uniref:TetR family transcriptional regulator n=1 Tax=Bacillus bingmayongensis TaxID=1150157 RepID=A0ABU5JQQ7_9BACI|nr:TetR family transcriptional regulator [Bacillus pseudomycoides]
METKSLIIDITTKLFQQKGYKGVGLNEILRACNITKGALYHHFPNGKEELLIACLQSLNEAITQTSQQVSGSIGIAVMVSLFSAKQESYLSSMANDLPAAATDSSFVFKISLILAIINVVLSLFMKKTQ